MSNQELVEQNKILEVIAGSHLYGTNIATSDKDFVGLFIAPERYYLGLSQITEVDLSLPSKLENGKNANDAVDRKFYELKKFIQLAKDNNPNILELLFIPDNNIVFKNYEAQTLLNHAHLFPHKGLTQKFIGYSKSQLQKARVKPENLKELIDAQEYLTRLIYSVAGKATPLGLLRIGAPNCLKFNKDFCAIGDLKFNLQIKIGDVLESITTRINKASHRADGFLQYGIDLKFMMHCIRLLLEGKQLLLTGIIQFPLTEAPFLLDIRNGKYSYEQLTNIAEELTKELDNISTKLPDEPYTDEIETLLIKLVKQHHKRVIS